MSIAKAFSMAAVAMTVLGAAMFTSEPDREHRRVARKERVKEKPKQRNGNKLAKRRKAGKPLFRV